jgi:hypothetical protein
MNPDKPVHANNVPTPTNSDYSRGQATHEQIARRAEKLWRDRNQPSGQDQAIWLEAEAQLKSEAEARPVAGTESRPYVDEPATQLKSRTKVQDPSEAAAQTRSATDSKSKKSAGKLRNQ